MKKQKWTEKPMTWGGYAAFCVVCSVISMITTACYYITLFEPAWWTRLKETVKRRFSKKTYVE